MQYLICIEVVRSLFFSFTKNCHENCGVVCFNISSTIHNIRGKGLRKQLLNGSPVKPSRHVHMGVWFITLHCASTPQEPGQGSMHFSRIQAKLLEHSGFIVHSGLQFGGLPKYPTTQEQEGKPLISWHIEFAPHGDGTQGFILINGLSGSTAKKL